MSLVNEMFDIYLKRQNEQEIDVLSWIKVEVGMLLVKKKKIRYWQDILGKDNEYFNNLNIKLEILEEKSMYDVEKEKFILPDYILYIDGKLIGRFSDYMKGLV